MYAGEFYPVSDKVTLEFAIKAYDANGMIWTLWTYKGYNGWAANSDWFLYGSTSNELTVDIQNDSYEEIARKWGEGLQTNSGNFTEAGIYRTAKQFLPDATLENAPFNTQEDVDNYVASAPKTGGGFHGQTTCFFCKSYQAIASIPIIGDIMRQIHSLIHTYYTSKNMK